METQQSTAVNNTLISQAQLLNHWQGHRNISRKLIEAYPEEQMFTYAIGGMRTFAELVMEIMDLTTGIEGMATGKWKTMDEMSHVNGHKPATKAEVLQRWDNMTAEINKFWGMIAPEKFQDTVMAFGAYEGTVYSTILYIIDNEIHHRAQAYVYLRSLGITPPPFWDRN